MPSGIWARVGPSNHVLDGGPGRFGLLSNYLDLWFIFSFSIHIICNVYNVLFGITVSALWALIILLILFSGVSHLLFVFRQWMNDELTTDVDLDLTEVDVCNHGSLHDEISARRHCWGARQVHSGSITHDTWILSTQVVVPQGGRCSCRRHIRQSNDEVIWEMAWNEKKTRSSANAEEPRKHASVDIM